MKLIDFQDFNDRVIMQVKSNFRSSITIPEKSWVRFRDVFSDYVDKMGEVTEKPSSGATTSGSQSGDQSGGQSGPAATAGSGK